MEVKDVPYYIPTPFNSLSFIYTFIKVYAYTVASGIICLYSGSHCKNVSLLTLYTLCIVCDVICKIRRST